MENNNQKQNGFSYTYSAKEQAELKKIREKYTVPSEVEDKMERLRRLDASVTQTAQTVALIIGIFGSEHQNSVIIVGKLRLNAVFSEMIGNISAF